MNQPENLRFHAFADQRQERQNSTIKGRERFHILIDGDGNFCLGYWERMRQDHASDYHQQAAGWNQRKTPLKREIGHMVLSVINGRHFHVFWANPRYVANPVTGNRLAGGSTTADVAQVLEARPFPSQR